MLVALIAQTALTLVVLYLSYKERIRLTNIIISKSPLEVMQLEAEKKVKRESSVEAEPRIFGM